MRREELRLVVERSDNGVADVTVYVAGEVVAIQRVVEGARCLMGTIVPLEVGGTVVQLVVINPSA